MDYSTEVNQNKGICTVHVTGRIKRPDDSLVLQQLAKTIDKEQGIKKFLFDMTKAEIVGETIDALQVGIMPTDPGFKMTTHRTALVHSRQTADNVLMEETLTHRGYNVRVFYNLDEANEWLMAKEK